MVNYYVSYVVPIRMHLTGVAKKNILETFITLMREKIIVHRVVLFGSRARGDADADSDMDVLVIVDDLSDVIFWMINL